MCLIWMLWAGLNEHNQWRPLLPRTKNRICTRINSGWTYIRFVAQKLFQIGMKCADIKYADIKYADLQPTGLQEEK